MLVSFLCKWEWKHEQLSVCTNSAETRIPSASLSTPVMTRRMWMLVVLEFCEKVVFVQKVCRRGSFWSTIGYFVDKCRDSKFSLVCGQQSLEQNSFTLEQWIPPLIKMLLLIASGRYGYLIAAHLKGGRGQWSPLKVLNGGQCQPHSKNWCNDTLGLSLKLAPKIWHAGVNCFLLGATLS